MGLLATHGLYPKVIAQSDAGDAAPRRRFLGESLRWSLEQGLSAVQGMVELNPYAGPV